MMTDPIADFLTRIRNATQAKHEAVTAPASRMKTALAGILKDEGFIGGYQLHKDEGPQGTLHVVLKYGPDGSPVIQGLERVSRPGRRVYVPKADIPKVLGGLGTAIVSTSKGVLTDRQAREKGVGGEYLCSIW
jgi:small subunit ribosomal protein S8